MNSQHLDLPREVTIRGNTVVLRMIEGNDLSQVYKIADGLGWTLTYGDCHVFLSRILDRCLDCLTEKDY